MENNEKICDVEIISIRPGEEFKMPTPTRTKRIFVQTDAFKVAVISAKRDDAYHDEMAREYVLSNPKLNEEFEAYKKKMGKASYIDFLILDQGGMVAGGRNKSGRLVIITTMENNNSAMNKIMSAYMRNGFVHEKPTAQAGMGDY